jgi:hypothetical protein
MPLSGKGMLVSRMNISSEHEQEFNRWYDKEHLAERVAIEGFLEARRYIALSAEAKYIALYTTENFEVLNGPAYRAVLQSQTQWSLDNISRLQDPSRAICNVTISIGQGRGSILGTVRIRPEQSSAELLRTQLKEKFQDLSDRDGLLSLHLVESDPELSKPLDAVVPPVGAGDWYILIDGTDAEVVERIARDEFRSLVYSARGEQVSSDTYRLLWDAAKSELNRN